MTSLILTNFDSHERHEAPEWGTGKLKEKVPLWSSKAPTWHLSGEPIQQFYQLTQLKKSNLRPSDQLLPKPQEAYIGEQTINLPAPAEHPYSSHIPRLKIFPSFAVTSEDPKRGVEARRNPPLTAETPAAPYDVQIIHKTKGAGDRHEIQALPSQGLKKGLSWNGEDGFPHKTKLFLERQSFYPIPPTLVVPNLQDRSKTDMAMSDRAANVTRNLERVQWKTTYEQNHTGIGPANTYKLDNLNDKREFQLVTGLEDNDVYPWFTNTYERSRPQEGRLSHSNPTPLTLRGAAQENSGYIRKPTLSEREESRLWNGKEYVNLPEPDNHATAQWREWETINHPVSRFSALVEKQNSTAQDAMPRVEQGLDRLADMREITYMDTLAQQHHNNIQQMEASNRWNLLESLKPAHDIGFLDRKLQISTPKEQPSVFYGHEGKYNEERAGLYKTSYDPAKLAFKLDSDQGKLNIRNTVPSAQDALYYPTDLNLQADMLRVHSETDPRKVPIFSERPDIYDMFDPFHRDRHMLNTQLQPTATTARPRLQEGEIVLTTSTAGNSYNTQKFLQEYSLPHNVRAESMALMSIENKNLENVRVNATKKAFNDKISVTSGAGVSPLVQNKESLDNPKVLLYTPRGPIPSSVRSESSGFLPELRKEENAAATSADSMQRSTEAFRPTSPKKNKLESRAMLTDTERLFLSQKEKTTARNLFEGNASNVIPGHAATTLKTTYESQYRPATSVVAPSCIRLKEWEPGQGIPRPQTSLLQIQNTFSRSEVYRKLNSDFPERPPNLIENIHTGRQHEFGNMNAQVLRGTLINV